MLLFNIKQIFQPRSKYFFWFFEHYFFSKLVIFYPSRIYNFSSFLVKVSTFFNCLKFFHVEFNINVFSNCEINFILALILGKWIAEIEYHPITWESSRIFLLRRVKNLKNSHRNFPTSQIAILIRKFTCLKSHLASVTKSYTQISFPPQFLSIFSLHPTSQQFEKIPIRTLTQDTRAIVNKTAKSYTYTIRPAFNCFYVFYVYARINRTNYHKLTNNE